MTKEKLFFRIALIVLVLSSALAGSVESTAKVIKNPYIHKGQNTRNLQIDAVEISDNATIIDITMYHKPKNWVAIDSRSYITAKGRQYNVQGAENIVLGRKEWMDSTGLIKARLFFPAIPKDTERIDFKEPDGWKVYGIDVTGDTVIKGAGHLGISDDSDSEPKFDDIKGQYGFDYNYVSPLMIKAISKSDLTKELKSLSLDKISSIEVIKSKYSGEDDVFKRMVENAFSSPGMTNITYRTSDEQETVRLSVEFAGRNDKENIKRLLFYKSGKYCQDVALLYITGNITFDDILKLIK